MERLRLTADINSVDESLKQAPLIWAVEQGTYSEIETLLKDDKINVNCADARGRTPFSIAAGHLRVDIMQLLLRNRANPHKEDEERHTGFWWFLKTRSDRAFGMPLDLVSRGNLGDLIDNLPRPNDHDSKGRTWLSWAAEFGDSLVVNYFLRARDVSANVRDLINGGVGAFAMTPLLWAAERNNENLMDLMTRNKTDVSLNYLVQNSEILGQEKALSLVARLLHSSGDRFITERKDLEGKQPIHLACLRENEDIVEMLMDDGATLHSMDNDGRIPLQCALHMKNERIVKRLLSSMSLSDLRPVQSLDWFKLKNEETSWIEVSQRPTGKGFDYKLIDKAEGDILLLGEQRRLYLCAKHDIWSDLPRHFGAQKEMITEEKRSRYIQYIHKAFLDFAVTYISLVLPVLDQDHFSSHDNLQEPWGVAWIKGSDLKDSVKVSFSKIPDGRIPDTDTELFHLLLEHLRREWDDACSAAIAQIDVLRKKQMHKKGRELDFIDELANNASTRAKIQECLKSQIDRLKSEAIPGLAFKDQRTAQKMAQLVQEIEKSAEERLDKMEQSVRELLQIELAWVSRNEAASIKRLSWITFIFLPLMFASSLFGMNVNVLEGNPDWRWYLLFAVLCFLLTGVLWKFFRDFRGWKSERGEGIWKELFKRKGARYRSNSPA